jgi:hypothetical protein
METLIPVTITVGYEQIRAMIDQMPDEEKERLASYLDRQTLVRRIERMRSELSSCAITDEEIMAEVKAVRKARAERARGH